MFKPNQYQEAIYHAVATSSRNLAISAVAGSGKTTTLIESYNLLPRNAKVLFLAFNKHISESLAAKLPGCDCKTIHSLGNMALRNAGKVTMSEYKLADISDEIVSSFKLVSEDDYLPLNNIVREVVNMARLTLTDMSDMYEFFRMLEHYDITADLHTLKTPINENHILELAADVLTKSNNAWKRRGQIDFTDMLYLPNRFNLPVKEYDVVLVDEAQDLSMAQMGLVLKAARGGRIIAVGDPRQAINGFAGANNDSFQQIVLATNAQVLPLSVCYRCPQSHIRMAQAIVPEIEWSETAPEGITADVSIQQMPDMIHSGDLVVCRVNAPLIGCALRLIAGGIQARVRGRNVADGLVKFIKEAGRIDMDGDQSFIALFPKQLSALAAHKCAILSEQKHKETQIEAILDKRECITTFLAAKPGITSIGQLCEEVGNLFADDRAAVWLSSIHRAKGLEANRVFVLQPDRMMLTATGWQAEQESNLKYVGLTRAKEAMYFVR